MIYRLSLLPCIAVSLAASHLAFAQEGYKKYQKPDGTSPTKCCGATASGAANSQIEGGPKGNNGTYGPCTCIVEELENYGSFSIYDANYHSDCSDCSSPQAVQVLGPGGQDYDECPDECRATFETRVDLGAHLSHKRPWAWEDANEERPLPDPNRVVSLGEPVATSFVIPGTGQRVLAKLFLYKFLTPGNELRIVAVGHEVDSTGDELPLKPLPGSVSRVKLGVGEDPPEFDHLYEVKVGNVSYAVVTTHYPRE